jgi:hypothetical protein
VCIKEIEKLVSCVYGVIMHSGNVGRTLEKRVKHSAIPFLYLRSRYICCRKRNVNVTVSIAIQLRAYIIKQISDWFTSIVYIVPASNLRTGVVWPHLCGHRKATFLSTRIGPHPKIGISNFGGVLHHSARIRKQKTLQILCFVIFVEDYHKLTQTQFLIQSTSAIWRPCWQNRGLLKLALLGLLCAVASCYSLPFSHFGFKNILILSWIGWLAVVFSPFYFGNLSSSGK